MRPTFNDSFDYVIVREIARGGMGTVYEALQCGIKGFSKRVAIKVLSPELSALREMFVAEAHLVADLVHENIVQTYHLGEVDENLYITMELIDGVSLKRLMERHLELKCTLDPDLAAFIASRVARALEYAHTRTGPIDGQPLGIVHRDICPANVLVSKEGVVKLSDFGVAKVRARQLADLDDGQVLVGRARYMAPEQARLEETDSRADLYSLGVLLHDLLRCAPGSGPGASSLRGGMTLPIRMINPTIPEALAAIDDRMLERGRAKRYQRAGDLGLALERYLYGEGYGPTNLTLKAHLERLFPALYGLEEPTE